MSDYSSISFKNNGKLKLLIIVGTRPEIIRLAAVINKTRKYFDVILAHTGQNYDYNLNGVFIVADRKLTKRTAQQQTPLEILRVCNDPAVVRGHQRQRTVFALPKLTIPDDKVLLLEIVEKNGARHQTVEIAAKELLDAKLL